MTQVSSPIPLPTRHTDRVLRFDSLQFNYIQGMQYVEVVITIMTFTCAIIITSKIVGCSAENGPQHLECRSHTWSVQTCNAIGVPGLIL